ncbi:cupin domain-containing protein [Streptomyces scopuliridis]|uniref:cupin domain-containing protein n=1 Tax=Streptomyces scopuliridis TaxID=452529 RepID=UPI0036B923AA
MTFNFPAPDKDDPTWTAARAIIVPSSEGDTRFINGDVFTIKLRSALATGSLGFLEADVPPGVSAIPHTHGTEDEAFYLVSGEVEFVNGNTTHRCHAGDFVFIPRGTRHGYTNIGTHDAKMLIFFAPGGAEDLWGEVGEEAVPEAVDAPWSMEKFEQVSEAMQRYNMTMYPPEHAPVPDEPAKIED